MLTTYVGNLKLLMVTELCWIGCGIAKETTKAAVKWIVEKCEIYANFEPRYQSRNPQHFAKYKLAKVRSSYGPLAYFPIFSFLAKMLSFLLRAEMTTFLPEMKLNIGKICKRTITWTDFNKNLLLHVFCANYRLTTKHYLYWVQPKGTGYRGCRHWGGCWGCHGTPMFWQIS